MNTVRSSNDPLVGMKLGGCLIEDVLGRGGMGAVYRARHIALDKVVALKLLAPHLATEAEAVQRFQQEARAAAKIEHPNVVQVINVAEESGQHFIVMQFIEGQSLEDLLAKKGKLGLKAATGIAKDVACGLEALHKAGIIHRDIKPANILIQKDATVKITDFGLARNMRQRQGLTMQGVFMGTPEFVSPEQVQGTNVDHRTDLYALGVTYYLMLSGTLPFQGESAVETASLHLKEAPPPLELRVTDVDPRAAAIVKRLLEKDPAARIQEARLLRAEFEEILGGAVTTTVVKPPPLPTPASTAPTVPDIPVKGRLQGAAPAAAAPVPKADEVPIISSGPKRRHAADYGEIKPREFVVPPPPPKPEKKKDEEDGTSTARLMKPVDLGPLPSLEELARPKLPIAPPPPPPPPKTSVTPKSSIRRRTHRLGRNLLFWGIVGAGWFLFFVAGALGMSVRTDSFWENLTRPFLAGDGGVLVRIAVFVLGGLLLAVAGFQNRKEFEAAYSAGPAIMLFVFTGLLFYVGALHLPRVSTAPGVLARAAAGVAAAWDHPCHLLLVGAWGVLTGVALATPRGAGRAAYAVGGLIALLSIAALAGFGSGGNLPAVAARLKRPSSEGLPALAVLACAAVGFLLAFGQRRAAALRLLGALLVLAAGAGAVAVGAWKGAGTPFGASLGGAFAGLTEALVGQGGIVTLGALFGFWSACLLYNRFTPAYGA